MENCGTKSSPLQQAQVRYSDGHDRDIIFNKATIGDTETGVSGLVGVMTRITDTHNGALAVTSPPGQGACFHLSLPVCPRQPMDNS